MGRKGFAKSRHRDAKHPVMLRAAAPSASGAPLEKHCQISLRSEELLEGHSGSGIIRFRF